MSPDSLLPLCWGKSRHGVHPALYHLLDAGAVAEALVNADRGRAVRGLLDWDAATLGAVVALHDLGKFSPGFQAKCPHAIADQLRDELPWPQCPETNHATTTACHLAGDQGSLNLLLLARTLGAHHGRFGREEPKWSPTATALGDPPWADLRDAAIVAIAEAFRQPPDFLQHLEIDPPGAVVLAGLTAIADWLASDRCNFPATAHETCDWAAYRLRASQQAAAAVVRIGWAAPPAGPPPLSFQDLFGFGPNALQTAVVSAAATFDGPRLVVVEAPMGRGKTEAALYLADRLLAAAQHVGLYVALPTMATSSQMFDRVCRDYLDHRYDLNPAQAALLHGQAAFDPAFDALVKRETAAVDPTDLHDGESHGAVAAAAWFRGGKQGLLTPFAVGTIDQALLGALQSTHQFVRLYGLANKVVVLDEVHAYDAYTGTLLERLLSWLRVLGCSVVLLSATLTAARRTALLKAWKADQPATWGDYPRLTIAHQQTTVQPVAIEPVQPYRLQRLKVDPQQWTIAPRQRLARRLAGGGCAAWICNTVGRAQQAYSELCADPRFEDMRILLFHARFPLGRRLAIEKQVKALFGKSGERPERAVLVATQVVEQSLDLDFDLMISDPAPIDLLLQRAGRLHRHDRPRPPGLGRALLYWLWAADAAWHTLCGDFSKVYDEWPLQRTRELLGARHDVGTAAELARLVEDGYRDADARWLNRRTGEANQAQAVAMPRPDADDPFGMTVSGPGDDTQDPSLGAAALRALTRLGEPAVTVVVATLVDGRLDLGDGQPPLPRQTPPDHAAVHRLLQCTVRLSHRAWYAALRDQSEPAWEKIPELRHARLLPLQDDRCTLARPTIRRCEELGLVYE